MTEPIPQRETYSVSGNFLIRLSVVTSMVLVLAIPVTDAKGKKRRATAAAASSGGGGGVVLTSPTPTNPLEHNNRGVELGGKGLWPDAIREHEAALNGDPYNDQFRRNLSSAHLHYADLLANKKKWYEAIHHYREALYADPGNLPADNNLTACISQLGKDGNSYEVRENLGDQAEISGDYVTAIVEFRKCVKMRDDGPSRYRLAVALFKQGPSKVVESYEELMTAINKDWPKERRNDLANAHRLMGDILWEVALKAKQDGRGPVYMKRLNNVGICYRRAATINPNNTDAVRGLINCAREAVSIADNFANNLMLAGAYQLASDFDHAKQQYAKCWRMNPSSSELHKARDSFHLAVVNSPMASPAMVQNSILQVQKQLEKRPDDPFLLYIYGRGKETMKDSDTALLAYKKAYSINPFVHPDLAEGLKRITGGDPGDESEVDEEARDSETPGVTPEKGKGKGKSKGKGKEKGKTPAETKPALDPAIVSAVNEKIASGDLKGAEQQLYSEIEKDPTTAPGKVWLMLGQIQEKQGRLNEAQVAFRQADSTGEPGAAEGVKRISGIRAQPLVDRAKEELGKGDSVKARTTLEDALKITPDAPEIHQMLADVLDKLGEKEEAQKHRDRGK